MNESAGDDDEIWRERGQGKPWSCCGLDSVGLNRLAYDGRCSTHPKGALIELVPPSDVGIRCDVGGKTSA